MKKGKVSKRVTSSHKKSSMRGFPFMFMVLLVLGVVYLGMSGQLELLRDRVAGESNLRSVQAQGKLVGQAKDRVLLKHKTNVSPQSVADFHRRNGSRVRSNIGSSGVVVVEIPSRETPQQFIEKVKRTDSDKLEFIEPDNQVSPDLVSNDPLLSNEWHLPKMRVFDAWDYSKAEGVVLGVCDTGVSENNPDLSSVVIRELGYNTVDNSANWSNEGTDPLLHPHGSWVTGSAAALPGNEWGVAGPAWGARVIPVRITNEPSGWAYYSDAAECITYTADKGAKAVNLSYRMADSYSIDSVSAYAKSKGTLVFVAAGNDGVNTNYPDHPNFLAISATDQNDQKASFSSFGTYVDLAAPGVSILTNSGGGWVYVSGTSFASPLAMSVAALVWGANPSLTPDEVKNILLATADDLGEIGDDDSFGAGRVNAFRAVARAKGLPENPTPTLVPSATPVPITPNATPTGNQSGDTVLPTATVTYPTNKTRLATNQAIVITVNATDNVAVADVDLRVVLVTKLTNRRVTHTPIHNCLDTSQPYTCAWTIPSQRNATYLIEAQVRDTSGNRNVSRYVEFTVR